jgi:AmiR/NasT family two-component response regulator
MSQPANDAAPLRVVVADEVGERVSAVAELVRRAGHEVVAAETDLGGVQQAIEAHAAALAIVAVHDEEGHALELIEAINDTGNCLVVLMLDDDDPRIVRAALDRGLDAYASEHTVEALESAVALARRRFDELAALGRQIDGLEAGAARRSAIERAKGVLMERHGIDERAAYERLRSQARNTRTSLAAVAESVLAAHPLLPGGGEGTRD